jgi:flagellar capping protein FliD
MKLDDKTLERLAGQLGLSAASGHVERQVKQYENKSDDELIAELRRMQKKLEAANIPYETQMAALESLMPQMSGQQKARLEKLVGLLKQSYK